jgi:multidrug efflux pump subunit AcrB
LELREVLDQADYVNRRLGKLAGNLAMGGIAVCVVIFLLMGWRSAIVVATALPLTVLTVLFGMRVLEIPVHQMSITGLIIALGLLIDNAIVVTDEVRAQRVEGRSPQSAVGRTVGKLAVPLLGSTLTTAFAFAPIALMPGPAGEFVGAIAINVMMAIGASLVFSLTVIAALAALLIRLPAAGADVQIPAWRRFASGGVGWPGLTRVYRGGLRWLLARPWLAVGLAMVLPLSGFLLAPTLSEQFFPPADRDQCHVELKLAPGASLAETRQAARQVDRVLAEAPIRQVDWYFGESAPTFYYNVVADQQGEAGYAQAIVRFEGAVPISETIRRLQRRVDQRVTGARVLVRQLEQGPPFKAPVEVRIFGPDLRRLQQYGERARQILAGVPEVTHTASQLSETLPKLAIDVDPQAAQLAGLSPGQIGEQVRSALDGRLGGSVIQETEQLPVRVRFADGPRGELASVRGLDLIARPLDASASAGRTGNTTEGRTVPLRSLAKVDLRPETGVIVRLDRRRMNEIGAYLTAGTLPAQVLQEFQRRLEASDFRLPDGYELRYGGEASKRNDAVGNLMASVGVLVALMVTTLVLSFGSFRLAALIAAVGVLSIGLGLVAIWVGGYPFGFMAIIGLMGLVGIAINDSIVVLVTLQQDHADRVADLDGLVGSVMHCTRHVIATTLTTIAGFTPLIWDGGQFWPPLAVAVAGGVLGATLLGLVLVPAVFRLIYCRVSAGSDAVEQAPVRQPLWGRALRGA